MVVGNIYAHYGNIETNEYYQIYILIKDLGLLVFITTQMPLHHYNST